jgi:uncharacterized membrane protein
MVLKILGFFGRTLAVGFFVVFPIVLLYMLIGEFIDAVIALGTPIADFLPEDAFGEAETTQVVALLLLLVICFFTGLAVYTKTGQRIGHALEQKILEKIPGYTVLRHLSLRLSGDSSLDFYQPAMIQYSEKIRTPAFIVEEHQNGDFTVLFPIAPTPGLGTIQVVSKDSVEKLDVPVTQALECYWHWGVGTKESFCRGGKSRD